MLKSNIRLLALDIDGVLTDGGMYYSESGDEFKKFNTRDGLGIRKAVAAGLEVAFISSGINSKLISRRAELLNVKRVYVGTDEKLNVMEAWRKELNLEWNQIAYVGDDVNDLQVMKLAGLSACPADAVAKIKAVAHHTLNTKGGEGCVREFIERFITEV